MNPLVIYVLVLAGIVVLSMGLRRLVFVQTRRCFMCDTRVPVTERRCRYCGYYFEAVTQEERKKGSAGI